MTGRYDDGSDELARDQLRLITESWSPFARVSRRILADFVERTGRSSASLEDLKEQHPKDHTLQNVDPTKALMAAAQATPELAWSLESHRLNQTRGQVRARSAIRGMCRPELIWCDTDVIAREHLEPLVHLLAYVIGRDLDESTTVVIVGADAAPRAIRVWNRDAAPTFPPDEPPLQRNRPLTAEDLYRVVDYDRDEPRRSHVFVVTLDPAAPSADVLDDALKFDRILYLTDEVPNAVPERVRGLLANDLFVDGDPIPYYCAFIATVVVARDVRRRRPRRRSFEARRVRSARRRTAHEPFQSLTRIDRDACVLPVDLDRLARAWAEWNADRSTPFLDAISVECMSPDSVERWARAVTNRRVGIAVSGGGACAYRAGAVLECMDREGVPVDVFAGLSGGALVGAFYAHSGLAGFARIVALGPFIQLTAPLAMMTTWPLQAVVDAMLGGTRVEDLEVRFAAAAVALPPDDLPMTEVVVSGSIGEAVRVSGTLPPAFAETVKGGMRFTDGGAGSAVPAQVARDFGADIIFACNAIPGPAQSNPLPGWLRIATSLVAPMLQRQIDYFAWHSYFWRGVSQRFLREADIAFEFQPEQLSLLEAGQWMLSADILARARRGTDDITETVRELKTKWQIIGDRFWLRPSFKAQVAESRRKKSNAKRSSTAKSSTGKASAKKPSTRKASTRKASRKTSSTQPK